MRQPFYLAVRAANIQRDVLRASRAFANDFAPFLQDKTSPAIPFQCPPDQQRFAVGNENPGIDVFTGESGRDNDGIAFAKRLLKRGDPVVIVVLIHRDRLPGCRVRRTGGQQRHGCQDG